MITATKAHRMTLFGCCPEMAQLVCNNYIVVKIEKAVLQVAFPLE
jgi:hypothetical protein